MSADPTLLLEPELQKLAQRLATLRNARNWTLDDLAARSSLSVAYLSRLEKGERQPSLAAALSLANAYGLSLSELFAYEAQGRDEAVIRAADRQRQRGNGLLYTPLSRQGQVSTLQAVRLRVLPKREGDERYEHDGEEWLYVLSGRLRLYLENESFDLEPGDAAHFNARMPHRLVALGSEAAELIVVASAAPSTLLGSYL